MVLRLALQGDRPNAVRRIQIPVIPQWALVIDHL